MDPDPHPDPYQNVTDPKHCFFYHLLADLPKYSAYLGPEGVEDGHVVRLLHQLLLHEAEHGQRVPEQHLNMPRE